jgi:hypothetical protein
MHSYNWTPIIEGEEQYCSTLFFLMILTSVPEALINILISLLIFYQYWLHNFQYNFTIIDISVSEH